MEKLLAMAMAMAMAKEGRKEGKDERISLIKIWLCKERRRQDDSVLWDIIMAMAMEEERQ